MAKNNEEKQKKQREEDKKKQDEEKEDREDREWKEWKIENNVKDGNEEDLERSNIPGPVFYNSREI